MQTQLEHPGRSRWPLWAAVIFITALVARSIHLWQIAPAPFFPFKMGDAASYDQWAQRIAAGDWWGTDVFYQAPLYPYFLAAIYRVLGDDLFIVRLCQGTVGALSCVALAAAGWRIFSGAVGILAGLAMALYAPALFFDLLIQKSVLDGFFCCVLLALYGVLLTNDRRAIWLLLGAATGCLTLTRENAIVLVPAWMCVLPWSLQRSWRRSLWLLLGAVLILAPVAIRNSAVSGEFHVTTSQFGPNFYIGNNPQADGTYRPLRPYRGSAKYEQSDARELAEAAVGHALTPAEVSAYWTSQAWQFIRQQPLRWLRLMGLKFAYTWTAAELVDTEDMATYAEWSALLRGGRWLGHMGILLPCAVWGMWCTWPERRRLAPLYVMIALYACSVIAFYVLGRYRFPLTAPLLLFAAAGVWGAGRFWRSASRIRRGLAVGSVLFLLAACNYPLVSEQTMSATTHYNVGVELDAVGRVADAITEYQVAVTLNPRDSASHNNLASDYLALGYASEAIEQLRHALAVDPDFAEAHYNLGAAWLALRDGEQAALAFRRLVAMQPEMARAHYGLALALQLLNDRRAAEAAAREALRLDSDLSEARELLQALQAPPPG